MYSLRARVLYRFTPLYTKPPRFFLCLFFEGRKEKRRTKKNEKRLGLKNTLLKSTKKKCKNMCTFFLRERGEVYFSSALFPPIFNNPFLLLAFRFVSPQRRRRRRGRERVSSWLLGTMGVVVAEEEEDSSRRFHLVKKVVLER